MRTNWMIVRTKQVAYNSHRQTKDIVLLKPTNLDRELSVAKFKEAYDSLNTMTH
jgi:hypothetical protein